MPVYDDAELAALQVVRACAEEWHDDIGRAEKIATEITMPFFERHGSDGLHALVIVLGRLTAITWRKVLDEQLGRHSSRDEMLDEIDSFELHKLEQHAAEAEEGE